MKVVYKLARGICLVVRFVWTWIRLIFIELPYDLVNDVLIKRRRVRKAFEEYGWYWSYCNYLFAQEWKSLFKS